MRVYHSFWTVPMIEKRFSWDIPARAEQMLMMAALGCVSARTYGCHMVLHTDKLGKIIFDCIPYNEVYETCNDLHLPKIFWASAKLVALGHEPLGSVHLDIDAFIQSRNCVSIINNTQADLLIQNTEGGEKWYKDQMHFVLRNTDRTGTPLEYSNFNNWDAYNCGIVKFNNEQLKQKYLEWYWNFANQISEKGANDDWYHCTMCIPDLILEQWMLREFAQQGKHSVQELVGGWGCNGKEVGFCHLLGDAKTPEATRKARSLLQRMCPPVYENVVRKLAEIPEMFEL